MKRKIITVLAGIAGLVAVFFIVSGISKFIYRQTDEGAQNSQVSDAELQQAKPAMTEEEINALLAGMKKDDTAEASKDSEAVSDSAEEEQPTEEIPIKFDELWEINPDVYAWITIPGTDIDYPILQHPSDDAYYLNHNIDGSYGRPACIYTESLNSKDFTDNNTVIYGHNMKNGTMFAQLHKFEDKDFFDEHREVTIYLPDKVLHYKIFAVHTYDDRHLLYSFDFSKKEVYKDYLESVFSIRDMSANIDTDMTVTEDDKIVTLATCVYKQPSLRFYVQAVLMEDQDE